MQSQHIARRWALEREIAPLVKKEENTHTLSGEFWAYAIGPPFDKEIRERVAKVLLDNSLSIERINTQKITPELEELGERLAIASSLGDDAVILPTTTGTIGIETAIRSCLQIQHHRGYPEKKSIIALQNAYHGQGMLSLSLGEYKAHGENINHVYIPKGITQLVHHIEHSEHVDRLTTPLKKILEEKAEEIAGIIFEPVQGVGGFFPEKEYFCGLNELSSQHGVLLVADEIATWGSLGTHTACEYFGIKPDIMVGAKMFGNGFFPFDAVIYKANIYEDMQTQNISQAAGTRLYGGTYSGYYLGTIATLAGLEIIKREDLLTKGFEQAKSIKKTLRETLAATELIVSGEGRFLQVTSSNRMLAAAIKRNLEQGNTQSGSSYEIYPSINLGLYLVPPLTEWKLNPKELARDIKGVYDSLTQG